MKYGDKVYLYTTRYSRDTSMSSITQVPDNILSKKEHFKIHTGDCIATLLNWYSN